MNKKLLSLLCFTCILRANLFAQDIGVYLHVAYAKPYLINQYIKYNSASGSGFGVGFFIKINDHFEVNSLINATSMDFDDVELYIWNGSHSGNSIGTYENRNLSFGNFNIESQVKYYILDRQLGFGAGFFAGETGSNQQNGYYVFITKEKVTNNEFPNSSNGVNISGFLNGYNVGYTLGLYYEPLRQIQIFARYDRALSDIIPNAGVRDIIGKSRYGIFKTGVEIRLVRNHSIRRY